MLKPSDVRKETSSSGPPPSKKVKAWTEFYTWDNLPPKAVVEACIVAFAGDRSMSNLLCPISEVEVVEMCRAVYSQASPSSSRSSPSHSSHPSPSSHASPVSHPSPSNTNSGSRTKAPLPTSANWRLCQVLLVASVGSQYLEDSISDHMRTALFTSGKWYLDMAFGGGANNLQRLRANMLVGLYLVLDKSVTTMVYLSVLSRLTFIYTCMAVRISDITRARHLHRPGPRPRPAVATEATRIHRRRRCRNHGKLDVLEISLAIPGLYGWVGFFY